MSILKNLSVLREELIKTDQRTKDYFVRGADIVLKDSGIDPKLMLGVMVWAYMDLLQQAEEAVTRAVVDTVKAVAGLKDGDTVVIGGEAPKGPKDIN